MLVNLISNLYYIWSATLQSYTLNHVVVTFDAEVLMFDRVDLDPHTFYLVPFPILLTTVTHSLNSPNIFVDSHTY